MATVFLAQDLRHERLVALKVLHPELAQTLGPHRFQREIKLVARLQHPHILPVFDSGETAGNLWFTMPYVEGESLRQRLDRDKQLPVEEALRIAIDAARALDYAHEHGVIHRDIKPENLLLTKDGSTLVADFGIARALGEGWERLTEAGVAVGTPNYMSPEQAGGDLSLNARTDVYSLGCVVYEMLAGEPPFTAKSMQGLLAKHMQAPVPNLRVVRPTISAKQQQVLETALAKVPADRFSSAGDFAKALEKCSSAGAAGQRWRRRAAVLAVITVMLPIVVLLVRSVVVAQNTERDRAPGTALDPPRIAVLYFNDRTPDSSLRVFADGLTEELIHELSGVNAFRVISRNGVKPYRDRQVSFDSMVAALSVTTVVDGSVRRSGDRLLVRVDLINARSGTYVDSMSLERPITDFITLEREVAQQVAAALRRQMGQEVRLRGTLSATVSGPAKELVLRARRARDDATVLGGPPHLEDLRTALAALRRADSLLALAQVAEPRWLRPVIDRGWVANQRAGLLGSRERAAMLEEGMSFAEEAVRRAPQSAEALELRGTLRWRLVTELEAARPDSNRLQKAEVDLRAAVDRDSTLAGAWATLSYLLQVKGSFAEAAMAARHALREDAYLTDAREVFLQLFFSELMLGDFQQAAEWCRRGHLTAPNDWRFVECELTLLRHDLHAKPNPDRAWALVRELDRLDPVEKAKAAGHPYNPIYRRVVAATVSARSGRRDIARTEIARARRETEGDSSLRLDLAYDEAYLRLVLGERQGAEGLLRRLIEARPVLRPYLARDPLFQGLRVISEPGNP